MKSASEVKFWGHPDCERLCHEDFDDAVESILEDYDSENTPETIQVAGFAEMRPSLTEGSTLEWLLEWMDEEHGDPDGEGFEATPAMKGAERAFHDVVLSEYHSWACEEVCRKTVNCKEWIAKNRPDWAEEDDGEIDPPVPSFGGMR